MERNYFKQLHSTAAFQILISFCFIEKPQHSEISFVGVHFEWDPSEIFSIREKKGEKKESITRYRRWWGGDKREDRGRNEKLIEPKAVTRLRVNWIFRFHDSSPSLFSFISFSFLFPLLSLSLSLSLFFSPRRNSMERGRKGCKLDSSGH